MRPASSLVRLGALCLALACGCASACRGNGKSVPDAGAVPVDAPSPVDAAPEIGCDPYQPRMVPSSILIGPEGLENQLLALMDSAQSELWVMMYVITLDSFVDAIIAAHARGVDVRVLLDGAHAGNIAPRAALMAAGVAVRDAPATFAFAHSKVLLIDRAKAVIMTGNLTFGGMNDQRNYGVIDGDPEDIADARAIFESDFSAQGFPDLACTRLVVSPINARSRILGHINSAQSSLDLEVLYIRDQSILGAIGESRGRGVTVRVLLSDPADTADNLDTANALLAMGVDVRFLDTPDVHAKLVIADGVPLVGSQNMSFTSLNDNREVGVAVTTEAAAAELRAAFSGDWDLATPP